MSEFIRIPERQLEGVRAKLADLAKRAARLGLPVPTLETGQSGAERFKKTNEFGDTVTILKPWIEVRAEGNMPVFNGWRLLGTLQHVEGVVIVRAVPGHDIPAQYRAADPRDCDHCHARRARLNTYVLRHEDGRTLQLGGDCAQYYLPCADLEAMLGYFVALLGAVDAIGAADEDEDHGPREKPKFALESVLKATAAVIRTSGWISRTKAREAYAGTATADNVERYLDPPHVSYQNEEFKAWLKTIRDAKLAEDDATVTAAIAWAESLQDESDYAHNVRTVAALGWADSRMLGVACSILPTYRRTMERDEESKRTAEVSRHVGTIGKREVFAALQVAAVRYFESDYGTRAMVSFRDATGSILVWWTSAGGTDIRDMETSAGNGRRWNVKGTVKKHDTFRGVAQTILSRCAVTEGEHA